MADEPLGAVTMRTGHDFLESNPSGNATTAFNEVIPLTPARLPSTNAALFAGMLSSMIFAGAVEFVTAANARAGQRTGHMLRIRMVRVVMEVLHTCNVRCARPFDGLLCAL